MREAVQPIKPSNPLVFWRGTLSEDVVFGLGTFIW